MSLQHNLSNVLVELSAEEQELLSGGYSQRQRRRRGGVRQKVENNPVFSPVINIYPSETQPPDNFDQGPDSGSVDQGFDSGSVDQSPSRSRSYGNTYGR